MVILQLANQQPSEQCTQPNCGHIVTVSDIRSWQACGIQSLACYQIIKSVRLLHIAICEILWMVTPRVRFWRLMVCMTVWPPFACHPHNNIRTLYPSHTFENVSGWLIKGGDIRARRVWKYPTKIISAPISPSLTVNSAACKCKPNSWVNKFVSSIWNSVFSVNY